MKTSNINTQEMKPRKAGWFRTLENESGVALILALLLMIVMISLVPVAMEMSSKDMDRTTSYKESRETFYLADAGMEHAKSVVGSGDMQPLLDAGGLLTASIAGSTTMTYQGAQYTQVAFNDANGNSIGNYHLRVYDNNDEGVAADDPATDADNVVIIESVGVTYEDAAKTIIKDVKVIEAMIQKFSLPPLNFPSAVTLVGPLSNITSTGSGFNVQGGATSGGSIANGYNVDGTEDTSGDCPATNGIATESADSPQFVANMADCTANTCAEFSGGASGKIEGVDGGSPDIGTGQTDFTAADAEELHTILTADGIPNVSMTGPQSIAGTDVYGTATDPVIHHYSGDLSIGGDISGTGVLIIDGDLDITGSLDWNGIIMVGSCSTCNGALVGTGSATIYGAMVVGNNVDAAVNFTGNANIRYSCQAIDQASGVSQNFPLTVASWKEN